MELGKGVISTIAQNERMRSLRKNAVISNERSEEKSPGENVVISTTLGGEISQAAGFLLRGYLPAFDMTAFFSGDFSLRSI